MCHDWLIDIVERRKTYDIAERNDIEESGRALVVVDIFVGEDGGGLAHRIGELNQIFDCLHRIWTNLSFRPPIWFDSSVANAMTHYDETLNQTQIKSPYQTKCDCDWIATFFFLVALHCIPLLYFYYHKNHFQ